MPTLEWIGKNKVINHHQEVPFRVLERKYSYDENGQHEVFKTPKPTKFIQKFYKCSMASL